MSDLYGFDVECRNCGQLNYIAKSMCESRTIKRVNVYLTKMKCENCGSPSTISIMPRSNR